MRVQNEIDGREYVPVYVTPKRLSDGSSVFDVSIGSVVLAAVTERDAEQLADKIAEAVREHTNEDTQVVCMNYLVRA